MSFELNRNRAIKSASVAPMWEVRRIFKGREFINHIRAKDETEARKLLTSKHSVVLSVVRRA